MKRIIKDYFTFSKKERVAIAVLLLLIACFVAMPYLYPGKHEPPRVNKALAEYIAKNKNVADSSDGNIVAPDVIREKIPISKKESFPFDPNVITQEEWQRLGVAEKTARTIINYRSKGGKFRAADDIRKIWGIKKEDADRLVPFVRIESNKPVGRKENFLSKETVQQNVASVRKPIPAIEINTATEEEWKALPGIGDVLAKRILKFREHAGGFRSVEQVGKTYGLADSVFQRIAPFLQIDLNAIAKMDLNLVSAYELRRKLNVQDEVAKAIVLYRKQVRPFASVDELKKVRGMSDTLLLRIAVMLKVE